MSDDSQVLYKHIYNDIINHIESGVLKPGDKVPTEHELMEKYNVSRITVTRALQELVKSNKVVRYRSRGTFVKQENHKPNSTSTSHTSIAAGNYKNTIALILPFSSDNVPPLLYSVQRAVQDSNYMLAIFNSDKSVENERAILQQLANTNVAGIICHPIESYENVTYFSNILLNGTPLITIDKDIPYFNTPCIKTDNFTCAYKTVDYLVKNGHKKIAYYCHTLSDKNENLRFSGYLKALIDNNISPDESYFMEISPSSEAKIMLTENNSQLHLQINKQLRTVMSLQDPPTAIFCAFDLIGAYVEQQLSQLEIKVPEQLSIIGFDNSPLCEHLQIPLTSMSQDFEAIGKKAVDLLLKMINHQTLPSYSYMFDGKIIVRQSVKKLI